MKNILISIALLLGLVSCGADQQNVANVVFPTHAIAGASQSSPQILSALTFGLRANYTVTKTFSGYLVTDVIGTTGTQTVSLSAPQIVFSDMTVNLGIGDKSQTISAANLQSLIELYIAYFNRVPDADGLNYWIDQLVAGQSIDQIGTSFYNAAIQYSSLTGYSSSMSNSDFITLIYKNVLGRTSVDSSGMDHWLQGLANGSQTRGTLVRTILASAHTFKGDATYGYVADLLDNKLQFAKFFTIQQGLNYNTPEDSIKNTMAMVAAITPTSIADAVSMMSPILVRTMTYSNERKVSQLFNAEVADINGDELEDVILTGWAIDRQSTTRNSLVDLKILIQQTDGALVDKSAELFTSGENSIYGAQRILVEDFDGDGRLDIFLGGFQDVPSHHAPSVLFWNDGTKFSRTDFKEIVWAHAVCSADVFSSGRKDIILGGSDGYPYTMYRNRGNRLFTVERTLTGMSVASAGSCAAFRDSITKNLAIISTNMVSGASHSGHVMIFDQNMKYLRTVFLPQSEEPDGWNLVHDMINIVKYDLNSDGLLDLIITDNGDFRLNKPVGRFVALINTGDFNFIDKTSTYFPTQTREYIFGYYSRFITLNSKPHLFVGNPAVQSITSLWEFNGQQFTPSISGAFSSATEFKRAYIVPYKTKSGALNLLMHSSNSLGEYVFYTKRIN